ncbi:MULTISPECIES: ferrous iron transporter B [Alteromonadaceae]|uniref:ferrous iron transporter B n=1 Tax=Alteromonadaceae TaxID=72275 RepID=UPI001C08D8A4|nr:MULTISPECIES: ferrous iron transporter B [unclassified Aliiglaciecola]MBU2876998.1 ferrous iron transporter B [Aliiglaciecola lipolytica]MDO6712307.1 ferrous iron transporter B [Aliiglaciecola sp. 2_MG-2023]MDO6753287.1 ferrous iron transporter B [Aliiglaciecola sp. 1_MG-2023]
MSSTVSDNINNAQQKVVLIGRPNSGKSLLFNQLTGLQQKVANFPGVTVELKSGKMKDLTIVDFPGTYSLHSFSQDEQVAVDAIYKALDSDETSLIVCVLDASRLERSLVFGLQIQALAKKHNKGFVFVINMIDDALRFGHEIDVQGLSTELGSPVFALSAKTLIGLSEFQQALPELVEKHQSTIPKIVNDNHDDVIKRSRQLAYKFGMNANVVLKQQNQIDQFLLHNWLGGVAFMAIMFLLFQSIFTWATPLMDAVESGIGILASFVSEMLPEGIFNDFLNDAIFGGVGSFLVFVPQIMVLTFIIGLLEDSGYLARAALICHKPLSFFGLSGRSFIPYLSGHACAIPAIMAARTIESPRKRLITMMTIPLMSCSARLPVYALLIAVFIPQVQYLGGLVNTQGMVFFGLYMTGIVTALIVSFVMDKMHFADSDKSEMPFILELPSYRLPHWKPLMYRVLNSAKYFIRRAAPVIFMVSVGIWILGYFPIHEGGLENSYLGHIGHFIEPLFEPLGIDWRYGVAILMSFLAREVFVGTLGTLFGIEGADENIAGLAANIQNDGLTFAAGMGLLMFYVIALQCVATVATIKAETGSQKIAWGLVVGYGALAYLMAFIVYNIF